MKRNLIAVIFGIAVAVTLSIAMTSCDSGNTQTGTERKPSGTPKEAPGTGLMESQTTEKAPAAPPSSNE